MNGNYSKFFFPFFPMHKHCWQLCKHYLADYPGQVCRDKWAAPHILFPSCAYIVKNGVSIFQSKPILAYIDFLQ